MNKVWGIMLAMALCTASTAYAATMDASNGGANWTVLSGNSLDVSIFLTNSAGDNAKISCDLELVIGGSGTLPTFQSIDMVPAGGIFVGGSQGSALGLGTSDVYRHVDVGTATTNEGLLSKLVVNTTGVLPGVYSLTPVLDTGGAFTGSELLDGNADSIVFSRVAGTITVTPEPSTLILLAAAAVGLGLTWLRRRQ